MSAAAIADAKQILSVEPLTSTAFAPFGEVISFEAAREVFPINNGTTQRHHALAQIEVGDGHGLISLARAEPRALPFAVTMLERHPLGSQAWVPLSKQRYLVVVAESPQHPPRCFLAANGEGVNYRAGTWHHPLIALDAVSDFLIVDRGGDGANCDEVNLERTWWISDGREHYSVVSISRFDDEDISVGYAYHGVNYEISASDGSWRVRIYDDEPAAASLLSRSSHYRRPTPELIKFVRNRFKVLKVSVLDPAFGAYIEVT